MDQKLFILLTIDEKERKYTRQRPPYVTEDRMSMQTFLQSNPSLLKCVGSVNGG